MPLNYPHAAGEFSEVLHWAELKLVDDMLRALRQLDQLLHSRPTVSAYWRLVLFATLVG